VVSAAVSQPAITVPGNLAVSNETAEELFDAAFSRNWTAADPLIRRLDSLHTPFREMAIRSGLSAQLLDFYSMYVEDINAAAKSRDLRRIAAAANQLTGIGADFLSRFSVMVPAGVARMDYLGREVLLENADRDSVALLRRMQDIERAWSGVKPLLTGKKANRVAILMEKRVSHLGGDVLRNNHTQISSDAIGFLDDVDLVEQAFTR
jgi:hypothetical protein